MSRYIDAEDIEPHEIYEGGFVMVAYMDDIDAIPTADVVPVIHAKLLNPNPYGSCSNCNNLIDIRDGFNYCPQCGAKMDLEVNES